MSQQWKEEQRLRIIASQFGTICQMTDKRDVGKLCDSIHGLNPFTSAATEHGKLQEKHAGKKLEELEGVIVH